MQGKRGAVAASAWAPLGAFALPRSTQRCCLARRPAPGPPLRLQLGSRYTITTLNKIPPVAAVNDKHFLEKVGGLCCVAAAHNA